MNDQHPKRMVNLPLIGGQLVTYGIRLGAVTVFKLAALYALAIGLLSLVIRTQDSSRIAIPFVTIFVILFVYGVIPATALGALNGVLLASILVIVKRRLANWIMLGIGTIVGIGIVWIFHEILWALVGVPSFRGTWQVIPSIVFVFTSMWLSWKLNSRSQ